LFSYRCPRCGKQHTDERSFTEAFQAQCLRCAQPISVTRELVQVGPESNGAAAKSEAITDRPAANGGNGTAVKDANGSRQPRQAAVTIVAGVQRAQLVEDPASSAETDEAPEAEPAEAEAPAAPPRGQSKPKKSAGPSTGPATKPDKAAEDAARKKKMIVLVTSIGVPLVLLCGLGAFFVFNRSPKKPAAKTTKSSAKKTPEKKKDEPKKEKEKEKAKQPAPGPSPGPTPQVAAYRLSAALLAADLAGDAPRTNTRYKNAVLEVSGILDRLTGAGAKPGAGPQFAPDKGPKDKGPKDKGPPPPGQAFFRTEQAAVSCDLATLSGEAHRRQALVPGAFFTVRGVYRQDGLLVNCQLLDPIAVADTKYAGKTMEIVGTVDSVGAIKQDNEEFPAITLEGETNGALVIRCVFGKAHFEDVKKVQRGAVMGVRGTCSGRRFDKKQYEVRFDNCQLADTTGRESAAGRVLAPELARDYEEDLRPYYLPPRGKETRVEAPMSVTDLSKAWKADSNSLQRYRHKVITVTATASRREPPNRLVLEPVETDQPLRVSCLFDSKTYARLGAGPAFRVTGLCMGQEKDGRLRLDNCEVDPSQLRHEGPVLTENFYPHREGGVRIYDLAVYPPMIKRAQVVRQEWVQRKDGNTETVITHTLAGMPPGDSLFPTTKNTSADSWTKLPWVKKLKVRLPGPFYLRRTNVGFLEVGRRVIAPGRGNATVMEPILKLGAKPGDTWNWRLQSEDHTYTFVGFETVREQRTAVVREVVFDNIAERQTREIRHVYLEGVGEIERREWQCITMTEKKLVAEKRMVRAESLNLGPEMKK
jgi:hypothetical protein